MAGYYNKDKDYSKELMRTDLSAGERAQLTQERQNKIDAVYGGKEPTLADGSGKTYTERYGGSSSGGSVRSEKTGRDYYYDTSGPTQTGWVRDDGSAANPYYKDTTPYAKGTKPAIKGADMSRDMRWAGQTVQKNGYAITYDQNGYAVSAVNVRNGARREDLANVYQRVDADGIPIYASYADGTRGAGYGVPSSDENMRVADMALSRLIGGGGEEYAGYGYGYGGAPSYTSRYDAKLNELVDQILNRGPFSYDAENDPLYQFYQDRYQRNGDKAMRDTLGAQAARTGGLSSSYAGSVAQQSYNDYMQGLNDIVPELYKLAYSMYKDDEDSQRANVEMLRALEQGDYAKFQDLLAQYNTDRSFNYGVFSDARNFGYQQQRDNIEDSRYNAERAYKLSNASKNKTSSSGSTGSKDAVYDYEGLFRAAQASGNPKSWLAQKGNYTKYGFTSSSGLYADYQEWEANGGGLDESNLGKNGRPTFGDLRRSITQLVNQGNGSAAFDLYDKYFDDMSEKQRNELNQLLGYNGG